MAVPVGQSIKIVNVHSQLVLEVKGAARGDGGLVQQFTDTGKSHQQWRLAVVDQDKTGENLYKIENVHSGKVLEVAEQALKPGMSILQWTHDRKALHHQWKLIPVVGKQDVYKVMNRNSGLVLDDENGRVDPPAPVKQYASWNDPDGRQQWQLVPAAATETSEVSTGHAGGRPSFPPDTRRLGVR